MQKLSPNAPVLSVMVVQSLIIDGEISSTVPHSARSASPEAVDRKIRIPPLLPFSPTPFHGPATFFPPVLSSLL